MGIRTLLRYLIGDRQAILEIAADRRAIWVGLLFVLSAGFAREYDGEDLRREPWHLLIPLAASIVSSFVLFTICSLRLVNSDPQRPPFFAAYRSFLTLFWMTAPLAWLYAVPYERFLGPADAVRANLWTLVVVAVWRVALMVRVVSVLMGYRVLSAVFLVMLFADILGLLAVYLTPTPQPVFAIMGGIRRTESERVILAFTHNLTCVGIFSTPVWLIGAVAATAKDKPAWHVPPLERDRRAVPSRSLLALAVASLLVWVPILPRTQAEQRLRFEVERDLRAGRIIEGLSQMTAHAPSDFPPHWEPPPRIGYGESNPPLLDVLEQIVECPPSPWVEALYVDKLRQYLGNSFHVYSLSDADAGRLIRVLRRLPAGPAVVAEDRLDWDRLESLLDRKDLPPSDKETLKDLLGLRKKSQPASDSGGRKQ